MSGSIDIERLRDSVRRGRIQWQRHSLEKMVKRGILREEIKKVLLDGIRIEDYPGDYPLPSALFFGKPDKRPLHAVAAFDEKSETVFVITAYEPDLDHFEDDLSTRRKK